MKPDYKHAFELIRDAVTKHACLDNVSKLETSQDKSWNKTALVFDLPDAAGFIIINLVTKSKGQ